MESQHRTCLAGRASRSAVTRATAHCLAGIVLSLTTVAALAGTLTIVDSEARYPEGPLWRDGKLLYVEYATGNIRSWDGTRVTVYWHQEGCGPSALIPFNGRLLVACYDTNSLVELGEGGKEVRTVRADSGGKPFIGPNDFTADGHGGIYFTASGVYDLKAPITGTVLHMSADGRSITEVANTIHYSNGLVVAKDQQHLLVAEMLAGRILSFPIGADGTLGARTVWARLQDLAAPTANEDGYNGPDGLKLGPDGNYYIAQNGSGRVLVVNEDRKLVRTIDVPTPYLTNMAFGTHGVVFLTGAFEQWKPPYPGVVYRWTP
ncbi:MAG: SMP-30/gluconolactonase/LRE family protein [Gammaproteobacteria bacterium]|nr:SMP-30/gluconolactonase/LRE family protein [Gammaproteobacteria bacterium]